ncbi:MAG: PIN domain-containing protein [Bacteroidota bacterium]
MKIFLDANILVSVLNKEYPVFTYSSRILSLADNKKFEVFTSPICLAIAFYFAEKKSGNALARKKIEILSNNLSIADSTQLIVRKTNKNKQIHDFEDGLEYYSALQSNCKCIITEDESDFYFSEIEVLNSRDFLVKNMI